jgi:hypothetical protein
VASLVTPGRRSSGGTPRSSFLLRTRSVGLPHLQNAPTQRAPRA